MNSRVIVLAEHQAVEVDLSTETAAAIHEDGHVRASPIAPGRFELKARDRVGVLRYGEVELRVTPKVSIGRLLYLAAHGKLDKTWNELEARLKSVDDPRSALAHVLIWHAERALRQTPLQGYRTEESAERHLRGRVLFDRQIARRPGIAIPVELRFDEYDLDIVENQVLAAALDLAGRVATEPGLVRSIAHLRLMLDGVTPWLGGIPVPEIPWTRLNQRYRSAIELCRLLFDRRSVDFGDGFVSGRGFMIDMPHVFEAFLTFALGAELELFGGSVRSQHSTTLDRDDAIKMYPDITWWQAGECRAVIDAKYKRVRNDDYPNADAYQMLAYCTRLGLTEGWLVYADLDGGQPISHEIRHAGVTVRVESIELNGEIANLERSVSCLANRIQNQA